MAPPRTVDYEEVRRIRAFTGLSYAKIAARLGVGTDAVRLALQTPEQRARRHRASVEFTAAIRAAGIHHDYDSCGCGQPKDKKSASCVDCYKIRCGEQLARRLVEREAAVEAARLQFEEVHRLRRRGLVLRDIAVLTGVSRSTCSTWLRDGPPRGGFKKLRANPPAL